MDAQQSVTTWEHFEAAILALCIWREARGEGYEAMLAVAYVILVRVRDQRRWPNTILDVVTQPKQFSSMTYPGDPQLGKFPLHGEKSFQTAMKAANDAIYGAALSPVGASNHYYDSSIAPPTWATPDSFVTSIGKLKFHRI